MIAHHLGAIDMAKVALEHGEDPALRQLRGDHRRPGGEIAWLQDWLKQRGQ